MPHSSRTRAREFGFEDEDFEALRTLAKRVTGIHLADSKRELVYGRVSRRLRALGLRHFAAYRARLAAGDAVEMMEFCNAVTTNLTSFLREPHHFDFLRDRVLRAKAFDPNASRRVRIWSSACSSGEEAYSIAMAVADAIPAWRDWDIRILATDLDSQVLERARAGRYPAERVQHLSEPRLAAHFTRLRNAPEPTYQVSPELARLITFKQLNLMHEFPMAGPLDAIFCRNVVIYFDKQTQCDLFARIALLQRPGDFLFLGHSESLFMVSADYALVGKTIYRRA